MDDSRDACPEAGLVAGYAEGRLLPGEVERAEAHLARCPRCSRDVADVVRDSAAAGAPSRGARRLVLAPWTWAAAAAVLLAVGLAVALRRPSVDAMTEATLVAAATDLARARPDLFEGFRPLDREERLETPFQPRRGAAPALRSPSGRILDDLRPEFRWEEVPGIRSWRVSLLEADGRPVWTAESSGASLPYPPGEASLFPGKRYLWEASGEGPLGPERARLVFEVAPAEEAARVRARLAVVEMESPSRLRALLRAHVLLRDGFSAEAEAPAREALSGSPASDIARETLHAVLSRLGAHAEAEALLRDPREPTDGERR